MKSILKKFLLLFLLIFDLGFSETTHGRKFDLAISLGEVCQSAYNLHRNHLRFQAFPLDWCITPIDGLYNFFLLEGEGFGNKENLLFDVPIYHVTGVLDSSLGIYLMHYFEYEPKNTIIKNFDQVVVQNYEETVARYKRRIDRFFSVMRSEKKVLFVRLGISYSEAAILDQIIHSQYPNLDYLILAIDGTEEMKQDWQMERVKNVYLERKSVFESNDEDWTKIFNQFEFDIKDTHFFDYDPQFVDR